MAKVHLRRFIWFCNTEYVARHPDSLKKLRDRIGLTTIMPESSICHTSGFAASAQIADRGPFEDWRARQVLWKPAKKGIYPPVAGTVGGFDDTPLLRVIEASRDAGIEVWGHLGLWSYGGEVFPEYAMKDIEGNPLDRRYEKWGIGLCPSHPYVHAWTCDCLVDVIRRYDIDGFAVDHARYPAPASISGLAACGCGHCQQQAERLGYDFARAQQAILQLRRGLRGLRRQQVVSFAKGKAAVSDLLTWLGADPEIFQWLRFRAMLLADRMGQFRQALQETAGAQKVLGSDVLPPSTALLGGQLYSEWEKIADYLTGGSSFGSVVGWATTVTNLATEWAPALCRTVAQLEEGEALQLIYRLFGIDDLGLPLSVEQIRRGPLPLAKLYAREVSKLKALTSGQTPLYPPVSASAEPALVRQLCRAVVENGCDGALFGLNPDNEENLQVIREVFGDPPG